MLLFLAGGMAGKVMIGIKTPTPRQIRSSFLLFLCLGIVASCAGDQRIPDVKASEYPLPFYSQYSFQSTLEEQTRGTLPAENNLQSFEYLSNPGSSIYLPSILNRGGGFPPVIPEEVIRSMLKEVDLARALDDLKRLSGEEQICTISGCNLIMNRSTGSMGLGWAKEYVFAELSKIGYKVEYQNWTRSGYSDQNIIARKPGWLLPGEEIYLVAHLDGVDKSGSDRFPAADDNGSGVVSILELARVISRYTFSRTLVLLISTGEENGTLGVLEYLEGLSPDEFEAISKVINIDMIGYDANSDQVMQLWHGGHPSSKAFCQSMNETIQFYELELVPELAVGCG